MRARVRPELISALALALVGCRTPATYEVVYLDASKVEVHLAEGTEPSRVALADPTPGARVRRRVGGARLGPLVGGGYRVDLARTPSGAIDFTFTASAAAPEHARLVDDAGAVAIDFPAATGDLLDFPGFHLDGVTAIGGPPLSLQDGLHGLHFTFRPSYETQRELGWSPDVRLGLHTPRSNLASVVRVERAGPAYAFLAGVGGVLAASGAAFLLSDLGGDGGRGFRVGIGLPLLLTGLSSGGWGLFRFLQPEARIPIPLDEAVGAP